MNETAMLALILETYLAFHLGEQRVVGPHADVDAHLEAGAALPDDDGAGGHLLAAEGLHPETLSVGIPAVAA